MDGYSPENNYCALLCIEDPTTEGLYSHQIKMQGQIRFGEKSNGLVLALLLP